MRPKSLCFLFLGSKGLEHIRSYPEVFNKKTEMKIGLAGFPPEPEANIFTTNMMQELYVCSYMFTIPVETDLKYALLVATYEKALDNPESIHEFFVNFVSNYTKDQKLTFQDIANDLPDIYSKIRQTYLRTKVTGSVTIEISTSGNKKVEEKDAVSEVVNDIWLYDTENCEEDEEEKNGEEEEHEVEVE
ncbi:MAG: hypothetical protein FK733_19520 [Asgard group archaeon]|nr:hypothetical protein [Asgard group archaeon]